MPLSEIERLNARPIPLVPRLIFATRWPQLPLYYVGLMLAQAVYVYHFWVELVHLVEAALVKLATAIIGISSIHLLKTFINAENYSSKVLIAQTAIYITFLLSAMAVAGTDRLMVGAGRTAREHA